MNIRSITTFVDVTYPLDSTAIAAAGDAAKSLRDALETAGITVQTRRLAIQPFAAALSPDKVIELAKDLQAMAFVNEIDYISLGPVRLDDPTAYLETIPTLLEQTDNVFVGAEIATAAQGMDLARIRRVASIIRRASTIADGFGNLRFASLANVGAWSPYFPAAYHGGEGTRIALATESADLAVKAVSEATSLDDARSRLIRAVETEAERIEAIISKSLDRSIEFQGFDFSLAPYPDAARSIGGALEKLGIPAIGRYGSLMASAFLTDALDRANFRRTGFCGLMLPILEDVVLAQRAAEGLISVTEALSYSAVCGTGLDTIPLPDSISDDGLAAILLDVAALALRLDKPLTARLMPLPGKQAGDPVEFDFEFFANSRVMPIKDGPLTALLTSDERITIHPRPKRPS